MAQTVPEGHLRTTLPSAAGGDTSIYWIGGAIVVVVVGVLVYMNRKNLFGQSTIGQSTKSGAPSAPAAKACPHQTNCQPGCKPTGYPCSTGASLFSSSSSECYDANCCSGGSRGSFLNFSGATCEDKNKGHYPCTCNGLLMNSSGVAAKDSGTDEQCSIM